MIGLARPGHEIGFPMPGWTREMTEIRSVQRSLPGRGVALALFLVAAAFLVRPALIGGDEPHFAAMASSVAMDGDFDLANQYRDIATAGSFAAGKRFAGQALERHLVEKVNGLQFSHPLGLPILAAPFLWVAQEVAGLPWPDPVLGSLAILACFLGCLCGADLLGRFLGSASAGRFFAALVFCASPLWFYSRTFFTEPFVWSGVVAGVWMLTRRRFVAGGALFGVVILVREPALLITVPLLVGILLLCGRRAAASAAVGPAVALTMVLARNLFLNGGGLFDFPQPFHYGSIVAGTLGLLFDPAHGLLPFMPLAALAPIGFVLGRSRSERVVLACAATAFLLYFLLAAAWVEWRGGSCFGPRLVVPAIALLAPAIALAWRRWSAGPLAPLLFAAAAVGTGIEIAAIADPFHAFWAADPVSIVSRSGSTVAAFAVAAALAFIIFRRFNVPLESIVNQVASAGRTEAGPVVGNP